MQGLVRFPLQSLANKREGRARIEIIKGVRTQGLTEKPGEREKWEERVGW